jgi:hypothetical protein
MRRFFSRDDFSDLESELREHRPEPRADLLDELVSRAGQVPTRVPVRRPRLAAALVFAIVVLVALAAFGGVGYAKSSFVSAAKSSSHAVSSVVKKGHNENGNNNNNGNSNGGNNDPGHGNDPGQGHDPPFFHQYIRFVLICYPYRFGGHTQFRTIVVPLILVPFFKPPGTIGPCPVPPRR